jgi:hypothetical protein
MTMGSTCSPSGTFRRGDCSAPASSYSWGSSDRSGGPSDACREDRRRGAKSARARPRRGTRREPARPVRIAPRRASRDHAGQPVVPRTRPLTPRRAGDSGWLQSRKLRDDVSPRDSRLKSAGDDPRAAGRPGEAPAHRRVHRGRCARELGQDQSGVARALRSATDWERATEDDEFLQQMRALEAIGTSDGDAYERTAVIAPPRDHGPVRISYGAF